MEQPSNAPSSTIPSLTSDGAATSQDPIAGNISMSAMPLTTSSANGHVDVLQQANALVPNTAADTVSQSITAGNVNADSYSGSAKRIIHR